MKRPHFVFSFFTFFLLSASEAYTPQTYYLDQECDSALSANKDLILRFSDNATESDQSEWSCDVVIQATGHQRLLISPLHLNITELFVCNDNSLSILNSDGEPLTDPPWICGDHISRDTLNTSGGYAWFKFHKAEGVTQPGSFQFLLSFFSVAKNGNCPSNNFKCDNNLCISSDLQCNDYNDCGDDSDETWMCSTLHLVLVAVAGSIVGLTIVITTIACILRSRKRHYRSIQD